jgi:phosphoglycerate dehydrogenase-like enzyme
LVARLPPRVLVAPGRPDFVLSAVGQGGGRVVEADEEADAVVWTTWREIGSLRAVLAGRPAVRWVQLPMAGVERVAESGLFSSTEAAGVIWTCAKGCYAEPVAEHALCLALAGLRGLRERARASSWGEPAGVSLFGARVTVLGGGGIATSLLELLAPFRVRATVVRRTVRPLARAERTVDLSELHDVLPGSLVVFVALALSPSTVGVISREEISLMGEGAWLVNVARGRHVDTPALVAALQDCRIGGAALDVTDPEPLPEGHPLWSLPNCLITPHTADTEEMTRPLLAARIRENVERFAAGLPLVGTVDPAAGY